VERNAMKVSWTTSELKEMVLTFLSLLWGMVLVLPGNTFFPPNRVDYLGLYAEDWVWGTLMLLVTVPFLFINKRRSRLYRRFFHAFHWCFWAGIGLLVIVRGWVNGFDEVDLLLCSPFFALALLHGVMYIGLWQEV
jgi:hypothetical protein